MAGGNLLTVCRAAAAPGGGQYLRELGFRPAEIEHAPVVAARLLAQEGMLVMLYTRVGVGRLIGGVADSLTEPAEVQALDALLEAAEQYVANHHERLDEHRWSSHVLPRLASLEGDEPPGVTVAGRRALLAAFRAYEARSAVVGDIFRRVDSGVDAEKGAAADDLELLAVLIGRRCFLQFARRIRSALDDDELRSLLRWAGDLAGEAMSLPETR